MGGRYPLHILGRFRADLCLPSSSHSSPNSGSDQVLSRHDSDPHSLTTPVSTLASASTTAQSTSSYSVTRSRIVPVRSQPTRASIPLRPQTVGSGHVAIIREFLRKHLLRTTRHHNIANFGYPTPQHWEQTTRDDISIGTDLLGQLQSHVGERTSFSGVNPEKKTENGKPL